VAAERFDPEDMLGPAALRVTGWAWYKLGEMLFLVGSDTADEDRRPALMGGTPPPFWRLSELARVVEHGDSDPWRERVAHELLAAVMKDLMADGGFDWGRRRDG
jgi:hypothetical protein